MQHKLVRLNSLLAQEITSIINKELNDPRLSDTIISIHRVETTSNLSQSFVYFSTINHSLNAKSILHILNDASGFIRRLLSKSNIVSKCPNIHFRYETGTQESDQLEKIFDNIKNSQNNSGDPK